MRHSRAIRRTVLVVVVATIAASCGSSGASPGVTVPSIAFGPESNVDGILRPTPNGFSFANFGAASVSGEEFGGADLAAMFGSGTEVCASGADDTCVPTTEAAEWARMINESRQSGHCEGFIVQALQRFATKAAPVTSSLTSDGPVVHGIMRGFASQFMNGTRAESKEWSKHSVSDITAELVTSLRDGIPDYVLGLYSEFGGHAVLPYSVTFSDADHATIGIYDSNWPALERHVTVDLAAQEWVFSFDGPDPETDPNAWTGGTGAMDLSSLKTHVDGPCPFCDSKTTTTTPTMLAIRASAPTWSLATARGTISPSGAPVEGVHVSKVRAGSTIPAKTNEWVVTVEPTEISSGKSVRLSLPAGSSAVIVTPKAIARASTSKKALADFSISDRSITTDSQSATITLTNGNKQVTATNKAITLSLDATDVPVDRAVGTTIPLVVPTTVKSGTAMTTVAPGNQTTGGTATTVAGTNTQTTTPVVTAAPTTTTNPVNFTLAFDSGGTVGYGSSCQSELMEVTITGATTVNDVTATQAGTAIPDAMFQSGNTWKFYTVPTKPAGTYPIIVTVNASNGSRTKSFTISYDNDCDPTN